MTVGQPPPGGEMSAWLDEPESPLLAKGSRKSPLAHLRLTRGFPTLEADEIFISVGGALTGEFEQLTPN